MSLHPALTFWIGSIKTSLTYGPYSFPGQFSACFHGQDFALPCQGKLCQQHTPAWPCQVQQFSKTEIQHFHAGIVTVLEQDILASSSRCDTGQTIPKHSTVFTLTLSKNTKKYILTSLFSFLFNSSQLPMRAFSYSAFNSNLSH